MSKVRLNQIVALCVLATGIQAGEPELAALAQKGEGALTPALREAFLRDAEAAVVKELAGVRVSLSDEQLDIARKDPMIRDACFGSVYPPDPRILLNVLELRAQAGEPLFSKYKSLFVAGAVARRLVGVGPEALGEKEEWALRSKSEAEQKPGVRHWPHYSVVKVTPPDPVAANVHPKKDEPKARIAKKREEKWERHQDKMADPEGLEFIATFLKEKKITPTQLYASAGLKKELLAQMGNKAPKSGTIDEELLFRVMTREGLRPAERDPFPGMVEFVRYLDGIEPRFPITTAPWPLLMPLAKGWPLREASNIWERVTKSDKLPTYGKYRGKAPVVAARLEPSPWHWQSWQGTYQAGGVCHEMSSVGLGTFTSVGVPATKAGQPHHSCVLVYSHSKQGWFVGTKQGTHGPADTRSQWLFADPKVEMPEAYHMGLALAMNVGLSAYMDSRINLHVAEILTRRGVAATAARHLESAVRDNPYNTQAWDALMDHRADGASPALHKARLLQLLTTLIAGKEDDVLRFKQKATEVSLENEADEDYTDANPKKWSATYAALIGKTMLLPNLAPTDDPAVNAQILKLLRSSAGGPVPLQDTITDFEKAAATPTTAKQQQPTERKK